MRALDVCLNDRCVGRLIEGDDLWAFEYDPAWTTARDSFDLSPALSRSQFTHEDGGSERPVQWYFDNLLPEENLREAVSKDAGIRGDDAFALLEYLGAESAGSLVLSASGADPDPPGRLKELPDAELSDRIRNLPRATLSSGSPKRMSAAGAQHKLLVVYRDGKLFEPVGSEPSTHILKPNHPGDDHPASAINEYLVMSLASRLRLEVPPVHIRYVPEPVYIVDRFDRVVDGSGSTRRRHIIDACQLLNKSRLFKYQAAALGTLSSIVSHCRNKARTRLLLYQWLVFNILIANHDNHLKNLSFLVSEEGIDLAPAYDLLSTAAYNSKTFAGERANWPHVEMSIALPGAATFAEVTREAVLAAGESLGLAARTCVRELDRMLASLPPSLDAIAADIEARHAHQEAGVRRLIGAESRLVRVLKHVVVPEMVARVAIKRAGGAVAEAGGTR